MVLKNIVEWKWTVVYGKKSRPWPSIIMRMIFKVSLKTSAVFWSPSFICFNRPLWTIPLNFFKLKMVFCENNYGGKKHFFGKNIIFLSELIFWELLGGHFRLTNTDLTHRKFFFNLFSWTKKTRKRPNPIMIQAEIFLGSPIRQNGILTFQNFWVINQNWLSQKVLFA